MFRRDRNDAAARIAHAGGESCGALDGYIVCLGGAGRENDLARFRTDQSGNLTARLFDGRLGLLSHDVFGAVRIAVILGEERQHGCNDPRVAARGSLIIQVDGLIGAWSRSWLSNRT